MIYPKHDEVSQDSPHLPAKDMLADFVSVAHMRPRTSKGITDLLLPQTSTGFGASRPSKKSATIREWRD